MAEPFLTLLRQQFPGADERFVSALEQLDARARAASPRVLLTPEAWARHLGRVVTMAADVSTLDGPGLLLCAACLEGDREALAALDVQLRETGRPGLRRLGFSESDIDEVIQRARQHLLLSGGPPRLARFSGRGELGGWLRMVLVRLAADLRRQAGPDAELEDELLALPATADPELDAIRADYKAVFRAAFTTALAGLSDRQRALLRLHLVEHLAVDQLAPLFDTSRASVARWVAEAREALAVETRGRLAGQLGVSAGQLASLGAAVRSHLDLSIERMLKATATQGAPGPKG